MNLLWTAALWRQCRVIVYVNLG